jgi:hypothetical protein
VPDNRSRQAYEPRLLLPRPLLFTSTTSDLIWEGCPVAKGAGMAEFIRIRIERLPEGVYLATSLDVPGLMVETDTCGEAQRIAG